MVLFLDSIHKVDPYSTSTTEKGSFQGEIRNLVVLPLSPAHEKFFPMTTKGDGEHRGVSAD